MSFLSRLPIVGSLLASRPTLQLDPIASDNVGARPERRPRCLKYLLRANHVNFPLILADLHSHNATAEMLCSAYALDVDEKQLYDIYEHLTSVPHEGPEPSTTHDEAADAKGSEPKTGPRMNEWIASPHELISVDWRDFWGHREYQLAFVDFFEDALVMEYSYDWRRLLSDFMFSLPEDWPSLGSDGSDGEGRQRRLAHGLMGAGGLPLVHWAYAVEMESKELATEALALASILYGSPIHEFLDVPFVAAPPSTSTPSVFALFREMRATLLPAGTTTTTTTPVAARTTPDVVLSSRSDEILSYWARWSWEEPLGQFEELQRLAVMLLLSDTTRACDDDADRDADADADPCKTDRLRYHADFSDLVTSIHAIRVIVPTIPGEHRTTLLRGWLLYAMAAYLAAGLPEIRPLSDICGQHPEEAEELEEQEQEQEQGTMNHDAKGRGTVSHDESKGRGTVSHDESKGRGTDESEGESPQGPGHGQGQGQGAPRPSQRGSSTEEHSEEQVEAQERAWTQAKAIARSRGHWKDALFGTTARALVGIGETWEADAWALAASRHFFTTFVGWRDDGDA